MLFEEKHFGKLISAELSEYLRTYTTDDDRRPLAREGAGLAIINSVIRRKNNLTENTAPAIVELMRIAIKNCNTQINKATSAQAELRSMMLMGV